MSEIPTQSTEEKILKPATVETTGPNQDLAKPAPEPSDKPIDFTAPVRRLSGFVKLLGGAAGVGTALLVVGFLSRTGSYGVAGLPMISMDPTALVEVGAAATVDALSVVFGSWLRVGVLILGLLAAMAAVMLKDHPTVVRWLSRRNLALVFSVICLAVAVDLLIGLVGVARLADPNNRPAVRADLVETIEEDRESIFWSTQKEIRTTERATVPTESRLLSTLQFTGLLNGSSRTANSTSSGYSIRRGAVRHEARELFGWVVIWLVILCELAVAVRAWRGWLEHQKAKAELETPEFESEAKVPETPETADQTTEPHIDDVASEAAYHDPAPHELQVASSREADPDETSNSASTQAAADAQIDLAESQGPVEDSEDREAAIDEPEAQLDWRLPYGAVIQKILEPLMITCLAVTAVLVPVAHGVLATSIVGREHVIVHLKKSEDCLEVPKRDEGADKDKENPSSSIVDKPPSADSNGLSPQDLQQQLQQLFGVSPDSPSTCSSAQVEHALDLSTEVAMRERDLVSARRRGELDQSQAYLLKIRELLDHLEANPCPDVLLQIRNALPQPATYQLAPQAAEFFARRWTEIQVAVAGARIGHLLDYPRGKTTDLTILESRVEGTVLAPGRWSLQTVPQKCVAEVVVAPRERAPGSITGSDLGPSSGGGGKSTQKLKNVFSNNSADALAQAVELVNNNKDLSILQLGRVVSYLGQVGHLHRIGRPQLVYEAAKILGNVLSDEDKPNDIRAAAATGLTNIGGLLAAEQVFLSLEKLEDRAAEQVIEQVAAVPSIITAAGQLADDISPLVSENNFPGGQEILGKLGEFLAGVVRNADHTWDHRGAACTGLGNMGGLFAVTPLQDIISELVPGVTSDPSDVELNTILGTCATGIRLVFENGAPADDKSRQFLRDLLVNPEVPWGIRTIMIESLYQIGMWPEKEGLVKVFSDPQTHESLTQYAAAYLEDLDPRGTANLLLTLADDPNTDLELRERLLRGVTVLDGDYDGDGPTLETLLTWLKRPDLEPPLATAACDALLEFGARGGLTARTALLEEDVWEDTCVDRHTFGDALQQAASQTNKNVIEIWREHAERKKLLFELIPRRPLVTSKAPKTVFDLKQTVRFRDGSRRDLSDSPKDYVLVNFWATWCPPCRDEIPELSAFAENHPEVEVLGVSLDEGMSHEEIAYEANQLGSIYPTVLPGQGGMGESWGLNGVPYSFFIGSNGEILAEIEGGTNQKALERHLRYIKLRKARGESAGASTLQVAPSVETIPTMPGEKPPSPITTEPSASAPGAP